MLKIKRLTAIMMLALLLSLCAPQALAGDILTPPVAGDVDTPGLNGWMGTPVANGDMNFPGLDGDIGMPGLYALFAALLG